MTRKELGILILLVLLCAVVELKNPQFLSAANLQNMSRLIGMFGIFSIGGGFVIISGGIDLSVGSVFALLGILLSMMLTEWHWPAALAVAAVLVIGTGLGLLHGLLITRLRLQPFIVTLCGLLLYRGIARYIAQDTTKGFGAQGFEWLRGLATGTIAGIPMPFVLMAGIAVIMWIILHRSIYGRHLLRSAVTPKQRDIPASVQIMSPPPHTSFPAVLQDSPQSSSRFTRIRFRLRLTVIFTNCMQLRLPCLAVAVCAAAKAPSSGSSSERRCCRF